MDKRTISSLFFPQYPSQAASCRYGRARGCPQPSPCPPKILNPILFVPAVPNFPHNRTEDAALGLTRLSLLPTLKGPGGPPEAGDKQRGAGLAGNGRGRGARIPQTPLEGNGLENSSKIKQGGGEKNTPGASQPRCETPNIFRALGGRFACTTQPVAAAALPKQPSKESWG